MKEPTHPRGSAPDRARGDIGKHNWSKCEALHKQGRSAALNSDHAAGQNR